MATGVFDGANEVEIKMLELAGLPQDGQTVVRWLYGRSIRSPGNSGHHVHVEAQSLVDDKMHARSTGSYSLVTQQPLVVKRNLAASGLVRWRCGRLKHTVPRIPCKKC